MGFPSYELLGVKVSAVQFTQIIHQMGTWIDQSSKGHIIIVANTHVLMESRENTSLKKAVDAASMVVPDGMPLVWVGRIRGYPLKKRAYGPDLMIAALEASNEKAWRHFFYGSTPEILAKMQTEIIAQWPGVEIAGVYSPPFRELTEQEDAEIVDQINRAKADILWVGMGCPKQECWIVEHQTRLNVAAMLGVGQAFDILAGAKAWAPEWMRSHGLEWLFRFAQEPKRLWKRYMVYAPRFVFLATLEQIEWWWSNRSKKKQANL